MNRNQNLSKARRAAAHQTRLPPSAEVARLRRRLTITAVIFAVLLIGGALVWADWYFGLPDDAQAAYVGRQSCVQCHQPQHEAWHGSHHDLAMDRATDETVIGDFKDAELTHHGIASRMFRRDGKFIVNTEGPDGKLADFEVKYVFGVDPLQQYMVEFDRPADMPANEIARLQVLRISWDTPNKKWFHLDPPDVKERLSPNDELHWTGLAQRWNNMCADCHSTNLKKNFDVAAGRYHTTCSEIDVSCEACHGPGSLHVQLAKSPSLFWDRKRGYALARLKDASNQPQVQACAPCHSRRRVLATGYAAGCNYYDYFANEGLSAAAYHADGQILDEVYEFTSFLESKMYQKNVRCTDCHDPHTARLKHEGNSVCTSCHQHPAGKYDGEIHHRHRVGSKGAQCVECHMPQTTYMDIDPRRDHSLRIPRPDLSVQLGTPNACTRCHLRDEHLPGPGTADREQKTGGEQLKKLLAREDLKEYAHWLLAAQRGDREVKDRLEEVNRWADTTLDKWYGKNRKKEPHFAAAFHSARQMLPDASKKLLELVNNRNQPAVVRATAASELGAYLEPSGPVMQALRKALQDGDPQVRASAIVSLQQDQSDAGVSAIAPLLNDRTRLVRTDAARALTVMKASGELRGEERAAFKSALQECFDAIQIDADRAAGHLMVGILYQHLDQFDKAEEAYRTAIRVEPTSIGPRMNLADLYDQLFQDAQRRAMQLAQTGNREAAEREIQAVAAQAAQITMLREEELTLLERDALLAPDHAAIQGQIGLARYLGHWQKEAEAGLFKAALLEPRNPGNLYRLAIYYKDSGRVAEAIPIADRLLKLRPGDRQFEQFAAELKSASIPSPPANSPATGP